MNPNDSKYHLHDLKEDHQADATAILRTIRYADISTITDMIHAAQKIHDVFSNRVTFKGPAEFSRVPRSFQGSRGVFKGAAQILCVLTRFPKSLQLQN